MYKRIQGFFIEFALCLDEVAAFVFFILHMSGRLRLVFDIANWKFGKSDVNYFVFAICDRKVAIPMYSINLEKVGCSRDKEKI